MMKRQLWTIIVLLVVGCTPSDPELTRESVDQLKAQNRKLSKAITDLRVDISERESFLANYTRRMAEILDHGIFHRKGRAPYSRPFFRSFAYTG